jgi:DNA excision repair protein ERCC-4
VEGNINAIEDLTENPFVFYGAISSITIDFKIPIITTLDSSHTAKLLVAMCSQKAQSKGPFIKKIRKSNDIRKQQLSILCSLPGVGEKTAIQLLEKFGSPIRVLSSSTAELAKIKGLGNVRAVKIKKILQNQSKYLKKSNQKTLHDS